MINTLHISLINGSKLQCQVFGIGIAVTAVLTLLTPLAAKMGISVLVAIRVIEGFFEVIWYLINVLPKS